MELTTRLTITSPDPRLIVRPALREAVSAGTRVLAEAMGARLPGRLRSTVAAEVEETPDGVVGRVGSTDFRARLLQQGVAAHVITPKRIRGQDTALRFFLGGRPVYAERVQHPGFRGRRVLPTPEEARAAVAAAFEVALARQRGEERLVVGR